MQVAEECTVISLVGNSLQWRVKYENGDGNVVHEGVLRPKGELWGDQGIIYNGSIVSEDGHHQATLGVSGPDVMLLLHK